MLLFVYCNWASIHEWLQVSMLWIVFIEIQRLINSFIIIIYISDNYPTVLWSLKMSTKQDMHCTS